MDLILTYVLIGKVGVYWDGPSYEVARTRSWFWAKLRARIHLWRYPFRRVTIYGLEPTNVSWFNISAEGKARTSIHETPEGVNKESSRATPNV